MATGKPVIVVLTGGSALAVPFAAAHAAALLDAWYPGEEGGNAVADVLFGDVESGRSPADHVLSLGRRSAAVRRLRDARAHLPLPRTRRRSTGSATASRTRRSATRTWRVAPDLKTISVEVQNSGARAGDEVVEVYLVPRDPPAYAPRLWLAAFARVPLAPGERRTVSLALPPEALTLVDEQGQRRPLTGAVDVAVGGAAARSRRALRRRRPRPHGLGAPRELTASGRSR